jgi:23S rRNA pseudouridine2457 synthase
MYPCGRLDSDSEGLVVLSDDGVFQARIASPEGKLWKTYWVQVEGEPDEAALSTLRSGVVIEGKRTLPARARRMSDPGLPERDPPVRFRKSVPTSWIEVGLREGRNRQVRRMTAAVGFPTLRLVRWCAGPFTLEGLAPGAWRELSIDEVRRAL